MQIIAQGSTLPAFFGSLGDNILKILLIGQRGNQLEEIKWDKLRVGQTAIWINCKLDKLELDKVRVGQTVVEEPGHNRLLDQGSIPLFLSIYDYDCPPCSCLHGLLFEARGTIFSETVKALV